LVGRRAFRDLEGTQITFSTKLLDTKNKNTTPRAEFDIFRSLPSSRGLYRDSAMIPLYRLNVGLYLV